MDRSRRAGVVLAGILALAATAWLPVASAAEPCATPRTCILEAIATLDHLRRKTVALLDCLALGER